MARKPATLVFADALPASPTLPHQPVKAEIRTMLQAIEDRTAFEAAAVSGTVNAYVLTFDPVIDGLRVGLRIRFPSLGPNTIDNWTITADGFGPVTARRNGGSVSTLGDTGVLGYMVECFYDGTKFVQDNPAVASNAGGGGAGLTSQKWGVFADWQCVEDATVGLAGAQVVAQRAMMDKIAASHPDLSKAVFIGDLVDRASNDTTGTAPPYGYPQLISDFNTRLPIKWSDVFALPGNHDRDGAAVGNFRDAFTINTYRRQVGKPFYHIRQGNLLQVFLGDMGGGVGGEIPNATVLWLQNVLDTHKNCNVIVWMHQPLEGTYLGLSAPEYRYQRDSERITDFLPDYDNIAFVGYGHVGISFTECLDNRVAFGTRHINFETGIPTAFNDLTGAAATAVRDLPYSVMILTDGGTSLTIQRWNGTTGTRVNAGADDITINWKFPLDLGGGAIDFDGRYHDDPAVSLADIPNYKREYWSVSQFRDETAPYAVSAGYKWLHNYIVADDSNDGMPALVGFGHAFYIPGTTSVVDANSQDMTVLPGYGFAGGWSFLKANDAEEDFGSTADLVLRDYLAGTNAAYTVLKCRPGASARPGLATINNLYVGDVDIDAASTTVDGVMLRKGDFSAFSLGGNTPVQVQRRTNNGNVISFYKDTTFVGSISVTGSATAYNTSSDATLKDDRGEATAAWALSTLAHIVIHDFAWKATGEADQGVFAQELAAIMPQAVTPGGMRLEGTDERYVPWAVDYSKLVPLLIRGFQAQQVLIDGLEARLARLEAR